MRVASLKTSFLFNVLNTVTGLLFPLITFPYAARVLMPEGIGTIYFLEAIVAYITLLTSLGIPMYAVREVARIRHDERLRNEVTFEILLLHAILTLIGYVAVYVIAVTVNKVKSDSLLFFVLSTGIFFNTIGVAWFYQAVEDFRYITIRSLVVRTLSLIALFIFVKTKEDLMYYAIINVCGTVGNNIFNFFRLKKYVSVSYLDFKRLNLTRHIKPTLKLFILTLVISLYVQLDTIMLGFMKSEEAVGFYTGASKITKVTLGLVTALGTVVLPRLSNFANTHQQTQFTALSKKALGLTVAMVLPMSVGIFILSDLIILLFCGSNFAPSILPLQILSPLITIIGLSAIVGVQILYSLGKENVMITATLIGAAINITMNIFFIPLFAQNGASISTLVAEFCVLFTMIILGRKYIPFQLYDKKYMNYFWGTVIMACVVYPIAKFSEQSPILTVGMSVSAGVAVYFGFLFVLRDTLIEEIKLAVVNFKQRKKN